MAVTGSKSKDLTIVLVALTLCLSFRGRGKQAARAELIPLEKVLPKIEFIHKDAKFLLLKNVELKQKILAGRQAQNEPKYVSAGQSEGAKNASQQQNTDNTQQPPAISSFLTQQRNSTTSAEEGAQNKIDFDDLEEFNKWVEANLEYAVENTQVTIESLQDEGQTNGLVNYSEQAVKDGIEGIKYWQAAITFQNKTLENEKFV